MSRTGTITYEHTTVLEVLSCGACEIPFAIPKSMHRRVLDNGDQFYCPNGHHIRYTENENEKLRKQLDRALARETHANDQREAAERSAAAYKGRVTRLKNRAAAGVCPCCNRSFENVRRHMASKHPDFVSEDAP